MASDLYDRARALRSAVLWQSNASVEHIVRALETERALALEEAAKVADAAVMQADASEEPGDDEWWARSAANGQATNIASAIRALIPAEERE